MSGDIWGKSINIMVWPSLKRWDCFSGGEERFIDSKDVWSWTLESWTCFRFCLRTAAKQFHSLKWAWEGQLLLPVPSRKSFSWAAPKIIQSFALGQIWFIYLYLIPLTHTGREQLKLKCRVLLKLKCCVYISRFCSINIRSYTLHHFFPDHFAWGTKSVSLAAFQLFLCQCEFLLSLKSFLWCVCGVFFSA